MIKMLKRRRESYTPPSDDENETQSPIVANEPKETIINHPMKEGEDEDREQSPSKDDGRIVMNDDDSNNYHPNDEMRIRQHILIFLRKTTMNSNSSTTASKSSNIKRPRDGKDILHAIRTFHILHMDDSNSNEKKEETVHHTTNNSKKDNKVELLKSVKYMLSLINCSSTKAKSEKDDDNSNNYTNNQISKYDISHLLLPWAIKSILQKSPNKQHQQQQDFNLQYENMNDTIQNEIFILWNTLATCLKVLVPNHDSYSESLTTKHFNDSRNTSSKRARVEHHNSVEEKGNRTKSPKTSIVDLSLILTRSTLNKLIPEAIQIVFDDDNTKGLKDVVATSFSILALLPFYKPTMDFACNSLLMLVNESVIRCSAHSYSCDTHANPSNKKTNDSENSHFSISLPSHNHLIIVNTTLQLFHSLQLKNVSNPKKIFSLVASEKMLDALSRLYYVCAPTSPSMSSTLTNTNTNTSKTLSEEGTSFTSTMELIQSILWSGLLHPEHHIDGFRTMRMSIPGASKTEREKNKMKKEKTNGKNKASTAILYSNSCYQQHLFSSLHNLVKAATVSKAHPILLLPILFEGFVIQTNEESVMRELNKDDGRKKSTSTSSHDLTKLQFCFWAQITSSLLSSSSTMNNTQEDIVVLRYIMSSLQKSIHLLLKFDTYLPSYNDPGNQHLSYLQSITNFVLSVEEKLYEYNSINKSTSTSMNHAIHIKSSILTALSGILQLNHHLLHHNLPRLFEIASRSISIIDLRKKSSHLITSAIGTYRNLRQLHHLFSNGLLMNSTNAQGNRIKLILNDNLVSRDLSLAVRHSPIGQLKEIWKILDAATIEGAETLLESKDKEKTGVIQNNICIIIHIFVLVIKSSQIKNFHAADVKELCKVSISSTVCKLISSITEEEGVQDIENNADAGIGTIFDLSSIISNQGLLLCGWLVDADTKCNFFLNVMERASDSLLSMDSIQSNGLQIIPTLLRTIKTKNLHRISLDGIDGKNNLGPLQHLCCHRIQQLHSMIHQQHQMEANSFEYNSIGDQSEHLSEEMIREAKILVDFVIHAATISTNSSDLSFSDENHFGLEAGWKIIVQTVSTWISYADKNHVELFLKWFFLTLASTPTVGKDINCTSESGESVKESKSSAGRDIHNERSIVLSLLHDASFFELEEVFCHIARVGFTCATDIVIGVVNKLLDENTVNTFHGMKELLYSSSSLLSHPLKWTDDFKSFSKQMSKFLKIKLSLDGEMDVSTYMKRALRLLRYLESIHVETLAYQDLPLVFDSFLRIDLTMYVLLSLFNELNLLFIQNMCEIMIICRRGIAMTLKWISEVEGNKFLPMSINFEQIQRVFPEYIFQSSILMVSKVSKCFKRENHVNDCCRAMTSSGGDVLTNLFSHHIISNKNNNLFSFMDNIGGFFNKGNKLNSSLKNDNELHIVIQLIRPMIRKILILYRIENKNYRSKEHIETLLNTCVNSAEMIRDGVLKQMLDHIQNKICSSSSKYIDSDWILLFSDFLGILSICSKAETFSLEDNMHLEVEKSCKKLMVEYTTEMSHFKNDQSRLVQEHFLYFICSLTWLHNNSPALFASFSKDINSKIIELISLQFVNCNGQIHPLLDSAYVSFLRNLADNEIIMLSRSLLSNSFAEPTITHPTHLKVASIVHCFQRIITVTRVQQEKSIFSDITTRFLEISLNLHVPISLQLSKFHGNDFDSIICTSQRFISFVLGEKELVFLNGVQISLILAKINSLFGNCTISECHVLMSLKLYKSCCHVIVCLLKYYSKQLYGCIPLLIVALRSHFKHILFFKRKDTREIVSTSSLEKIEAFIKICELFVPHKDIVKKHIVALILDFVDALKKGIDGNVKTRLMPGIFALLDLLSNYEINQLNSLMDVSEKPLFKTVYHNYQKMHQYKG